MVRVLTHDLIGEFFTHTQAGFIHSDAINDGIRTGKINMLKNARCQFRLLSTLLCEELTIFGKDNALTRRDVTVEFEILCIQGN